MDLGALVLDAAELHAHVRAVRRAEAQLGALALVAAAPVLLCHCAGKDRGHLPVRGLLHSIGSHGKDGAVEELDQLLASHTQREVLKHQGSRNQLVLRQLRHRVLHTGQWHETGAARRDGRHREAASVRTPLRPALSWAVRGLGALLLLVFLVFASGPGPLPLDLVFLLLFLLSLLGRSRALPLHLPLDLVLGLQALVLRQSQQLLFFGGLPL
mmetsp:Transcript_10868/g.24607  ORF Transcript_10868/g.24607 Transcript_10868/m.24607 type:complete len:213 (+) Transcript_10868:906-1544(+)